MKQILKCSMLCVILFITGCTEDENIMRGYSTADGDEIVFDAEAGYPTSRTIYDDYVPGSDNQGISWVNGDKVSIYSPTSPSLTQVDYVVKTKNGAEKKAVLQKINPGDVGLQWGGDPQTFCAVYPAKQQIKNEEIRKYVDFKNGVLTGYIPINQTHEITKDNGKWKAKPIMEYSYMVAKNTISRGDREKGVDLNFKPISSAIDIIIKGDGKQTVKISSINISSATKQLTGQFTCDLNTWNTPNGYPNCSIKGDDLSRNNIIIELRSGENNYIELGANEEITLTAFLMPQEDIKDLSLRLSAFNLSSKVLPLGDLGVQIVPHKKSRVSAKLPGWGTTDDTNEWMKYLDDATYVSQLSIPGTANSASYAYEAMGEDGRYFKAQTVSIEDQLKAGVRCFELRCPHGYGWIDFGKVFLQCNRQDINIRFDEAMNQFRDFLNKHPKEFLIVMPAYESNDGVGKAPAFMQGLNRYLRNKSDIRFSVYRPDITLGEVRGTIMIMTRVTTEEYSESDLQAVKNEGIQVGTVIDKWGSLKDLWGRRGYTLNGKRVPDYAEGIKGLQPGTMEYAMLTGNTYQNFRPNNLPKRTLEPDFVHTSYDSNKQNNVKFYVQDWARVVRNNTNLWINTDGNFKQYAYWQSSKKEKEDDIWNTFMKSVEDNRGKLGKYFYFNCIDGYFVIPHEIPVSNKKIPISAVPYVGGYEDHNLNYANGGIAGDIPGFAVEFNKFFNKKLIDLGSYNITGPTNVVMLDRALANEDGKNIVQIIVNNNFKFPLLLKPKK